MQKLTYEDKHIKVSVKLKVAEAGFREILENLVIPCFSGATFDSGMQRRVMADVEQTESPEFISKMKEMYSGLNDFTKE